MGDDATNEDMKKRALASLEEIGWWLDRTGFPTRSDGTEFSTWYARRYIKRLEAENADLRAMLTWLREQGVRVDYRSGWSAGRSGNPPQQPEEEFIANLRNAAGLETPASGP